MNADGTDVVRLTDNSTHDWPVAWSRSYTPAATAEVKNTPTPTPTATPAPPPVDVDSLEGRIATSCRWDDFYAICLTNADGSDEFQIESSSAQPDLSPDGKYYLHGDNWPDGGNKSIAVRLVIPGAPIGSLLNHYSGSSFNDYHPVWSPDGERIALGTTTDRARFTL